jgi:hypothetical protein
MWPLKNLIFYVAIFLFKVVNGSGRKFLLRPGKNMEDVLLEK